ncbi:MAG: DNA topoisomerase IB [Comamonadaceae bacterium]|nr:MAG: DNA topoisomerase IB [Comamonadaceae bacterium]
MPGLRRMKAGKSFRYKDSQGQWLRDEEEISRIRRLAIPPAYTDVWICPLANGHLQAIGLDARGRKQYRYHPEWRSLKDETKFERLEAFGQALPRIRARVARDLKPPAKGPALTRERVLATIVRLLDTTYVRVGNEEYAATNGSYGLTTLRNKHVQVQGGALRLKFRGKSGVMHEAKVDDARIARIVRSCQQLPGQDLFQYQDADGTPHGVSSTDVNDYLRDITAGGRAAAEDNAVRFTAKDFRTWHGTVQALELTRLACEHNEIAGTQIVKKAAAATRYGAKDIIAAVAKQLGNTPAVCKKSYVHPAVLALGTKLSGDPTEMKQIWDKLAGGSTAARRLHAAEHRLLAFLKEHRRELRKAQAAASRRRTPRSLNPTS